MCYNIREKGDERVEKRYTLIETAEILNVHRNTVYRWIVDENKLKADKIGRQWRVRESELKKFIEKGE